MTQTKWIGVRQDEEGWSAQVKGKWKSFDHEELAVVARDVDAYRTLGMKAELNLPRTLIRRIMRDGGADSLETRWGQEKYLDTLDAAIGRARKRLGGVASEKLEGAGGGTEARKRSSLYEGVYWVLNRWEARDGRRYGGRYEAERLAAVARDLMILDRLEKSLNYPVELLREIVELGGMKFLKTPGGRERFGTTLSAIDDARRGSELRRGSGK